jgi:HAE1 family hydrophobic/amphiphilic exporter-1
MNLADVSIRRPVFAAMLIIALVVFGVVAYPKVGVDLFPNVDFPVVTVTVIYPGADPETMETKVADPIEEVVNTLGGIKTLRSINLENVTQVIAEFELNVNVDQAVQDIRDKVSGVAGRLPPGVEPPVVQKFDIGATPIMAIALAGNLDPRELTRIADDVVKERVQRVAGVGGVELIGARERAIRVLADPAKLAGFGITVQDVAGAVRAQNLELPAGSVELGDHEIAVKTRGEVRTAAEVGDILIPGPPGQVLRVRDVAQVVDGSEKERSASYLDGRAAISLSVRKQSGSNTVAVAQAVKKALDEIKPQLDNAGVTLAVPSDMSVFIAHSIHDVQFDLVFGGLLAIAIILLFLRDSRATFISALAIPTSVVATFAFIQAMGFTFNNMTMLGLSLSIGILIDDAIVVIENIHRHMEMKKPPDQAASEATSEIFLAVLATTSCIVAVFVPVALMKGIVGRFFFQFGLTVSFAVAISMLVSFTLTPMMASRLLKAEHAQRNVVSRAIGRVLDWMDQGYGVVIRTALRRRAVTLVVALLALVGSVALVTRVKTEFIPPEDRGEFGVYVELPTGTSLDATSRFVEAISKDLRENGPGVALTLATIGGGAQGQINRGEVRVVLSPKKGRAYHQEELMAWLRERYGVLEGATISIAPIGAVGGGGFRSQPIQLNIRGRDLEQLVTVSEELKKRLDDVNGLVDLDTTYRGGKPEVQLKIQRERAADLGVPVASIATTLRALLAGDAVSELKDGVDVYDITLELRPEDAARVEELGNLQVRSTSGELVDLANVVELGRASGPSQIERQARQRQVTVLAALQGVPLGEAKQKVDGIVAEVVPKELTTDYAGMAQIMGESFGYMFTALLLAIALVYMILAAQFDSFVHPITIMLSLPFSVIGAFGALFISGMTLNIFSMIGIIMLMGLVTKNAILLVEFATQLRRRGIELREALVQAGVVRLRPIVMTTAAMVFGMLPVALALSEGGETRAPMAVCVIGGLITSTLLTLVVVPVFYTLMEGLTESGPMRWMKRRVLGTRAEPALVEAKQPASEIEEGAA